jgi:hypothetical protein
MLDLNMNKRIYYDPAALIDYDPNEHQDKPAVYVVCSKPVMVYGYRRSRHRVPAQTVGQLVHVRFTVKTHQNVPTVFFVDYTGYGVATISRNTFVEYFKTWKPDGPEVPPTT